MVENIEKICTLWFESKKPLIKPSSLSVYNNTLTASILPFFSGKIINNNEVQNFVIALTNSGRAKRTITDAVKLLGRILQFGESVGVCKNFVFNIEYPTILKQRKKESKAFSIIETRILRNHLMLNPSKYNLAILVGLSCGLRIGEVTGLKKSDFNLKSKMIHVNRTSQRIVLFDENNKKIGSRINVGTPKTKSSKRKVPVPHDVFDLVLSSCDDMDELDDYIFKSKHIDQPMDNRVLRMNYDLVLAKLKLPKINFHGLRHSFASNCLASKIDVKTTSSMLGHSNIKMTLEIYAHPSLEQKKDAVNKLGKLFG